MGMEKKDHIRALLSSTSGRQQWEQIHRAAWTEEDVERLYQNFEAARFQVAADRSLRQLRRQVGMIFQNYNLVYSLSVLQNVLHGRLGYMKGLKGVLGLYREEDKQKGLELLRELGLEDFAYNLASDLSGGQKQRVGIAWAIMQDPKLLLCDEPIASLNPSSAKTIMDLLRNMTRKRNIACIVNLHQLDVALKYSTRIIGLSRGEIVFDGVPEQLDDATMERIYGTSRENLMLGGSGDEQRNTADCQRGCLLGVSHRGLSAPGAAPGLCGNHGGCVPGLCGKPAGGEGHLSPAGG